MEAETTEVLEQSASETETVETEASDQQTEQETEATETNQSTAEGTDSQEDQSASDDQQQLPKLLQAYDKQTLDELCERFQLEPEDLQSKKTQYMLKKVLDDKIYLDSLKGENQAESTEDASKDIAETTPKSPDEQYAEFDKNLNDFIAKGRNGQPLNDPRLVEEFGREWLASQGITKPEQIADLKKQGFDPVRMSNAYAKFGTNLVATVLPAILSNAIESLYPGFGELFNNASEGNSWEGLRGKESYNQLPEFGTQGYRDAMAEVEKANPWFKDAQFKSRDARLEALASLSLGRRVDPKLMEQAVATGKTQATKAAGKLAVAKSLGAGKSKGELTPKSKGNDSLRAGIAAYMDSQRSGNK